MAFHQHSMLGMRLDYVDPHLALQALVQRARRGLGGYCCVPDSSQCVISHDDANHRRIVNAAEFVIGDSTILQRARSIRYGVPMVKALRGADMMLELCSLAATTGIRIGLFGGKNDLVLKALSESLVGRFPMIDLAFTHSPPFRALTDEEDREIVDRVNRLGVQLLFVGLGCPKQEQFMAAHRDRINAMMIGLGAAFDYNSGAIQPPPGWMHQAGLEWFYRLTREPTRLWRRYLLTAPRFVFLLLVDVINGGIRRAH